MSEIRITKENFDNEVLGADIPVLVDFWATWCGPCMMLAPTVEEIAKEYEGKVKVGKINVDEEPELAMRFRVSSIPTLILFKEGKAVDMAVGLRPKTAITAMLDK